MKFVDHAAADHVLDNHTDVTTLPPEVLASGSIALQFPTWTDGRAYSQARLLRGRLGYRGELRATGDVLVDMLPLLERTGFDAVTLRADQRLGTAQRVLKPFSGHYQADTLEPRPRYARTDAS